MFTRILLLLVIASVPRPSWAQGWDLAATMGMFAGRTPRDGNGTGYEELWFQNVQGAVTLGRDLSSHLKLEVEGSATTSGTQHRARLITVPGYSYSYPIHSEVTTSVRSVGATLTYQFRENEWVHPFVQAGVAADFDRLAVHREQFFYGRPQPGVPPERIAEGRTEGPTTTTALRAVLGGGTKVYVNERLFVRADGRWSFGRDRHNLATRVGLGIDF